MQQATLKAVSQPMDDMTPEEFIIYCARVSNPANQGNHETADKLCRYLIDKKHWSPFEMVSATIELKTTRDIGRQVLRHRSFSFQEFSQRYAEVVDFSDHRETRLQDHKNRQNSVDTDDADLPMSWQHRQDIMMQEAQAHYKWALDRGIAKEVARSILPEGLTMSTMYMSGTLRSWIHYLQMRCGNGTQKEHMELAQACANALYPVFPTIIDQTVLIPNGMNVGGS